MDTSALKIFEVVARLGGMNRAAQELNTVQSNVTHRVRLLEDELGTRLFERHSRGVTLTEVVIACCQTTAVIATEAVSGQSWRGEDAPIDCRNADR